MTVVVSFLRMTCIMFLLTASIVMMVITSTTVELRLECLCY